MRRRRASTNEQYPLPHSKDIVIAPGQLIPLELKLHEYRYRARQAGTPPIRHLDERSLAIHGFAALHQLSKQVILEIVVELAKTEGQGTPETPITMPEVGWHFANMTGVSVARAILGPYATPFMYYPHHRWYGPHFDHPADEPRDMGEVFVGAYGVARAYAYNRLDVLGGSTGLAAIPRPSGYYGQEPD